MAEHVDALDSTQIAAGATAALVDGGYVRVEAETPSLQLRVFEDSFGIVAIAVFESWHELASKWHEAQGYLVDVMAAKLGRREAKAWEGYLVLLTPGLVPAIEHTAVQSIRSDTTRVRKLVGTGSDLSTLASLANVLLPLLPLRIDDLASGPDVLSHLSGILTESGLSSEIADLVVKSFERNESIIENIHRRGAST